MPGGRRICPTVTVAVAVLIGALLVAPSSGLGQSTPRCATTNLRLDFVGGQAALSHRYWNLSLRNVGSGTCYLRGFPDVKLLDARAMPIYDPVARENGFAQRTVVIGPWQSVYFSFGYAVSAPCLPNFFYAYGIQVFPPGSKQGLVYYRGRFDVCGASLSRPRVYPLRATPSPS